MTRIFIVGSGRVGTFLHRKIPDSRLYSVRDVLGGKVKVGGEPVLITTRAVHVLPLLKLLRADPSKVFILQNGIYLLRKETSNYARGLILFSVKERVVFLGKSPFYSPKKDAAEELVQVLNRSGIPSEVVDREAMIRKEAMKLLMNAVANPLCAYYSEDFGSAVERNPELFLGIVSEGIMAFRLLGVDIKTKDVCELLLNVAKKYRGELPNESLVALNGDVDLLETPFINGFIVSTLAKYGKDFSANLRAIEMIYRVAWEKAQEKRKKE